jgi:poly-gamma-glutamate synthesis protein (capsule biosynthesis protein)
MRRLLLVLLLLSATMSCGVTPTSEPESPKGGESALPVVTIEPRLPPTPIVPVVGFGSRLRDWVPDDLRDLSDDRAERRISSLHLLSAEVAAITTAMSIDREAIGPRLVDHASHAKLRGALIADPRAVGIIAAERLEPSLIALRVDGQALTGVHRLRTWSEWPLTAALGADAPSDQAARLWTAVIGGDILIDRGVANTARRRERGADFAFDGGYATISGSRCCGLFGDRVTVAKRDGGKGAIRDLLSGADIAIANLESPTPRDWTYHNEGTRFTGDPRLLAGVARSGIDLLSLANNHIGDGGSVGILETIAAVEAAGMTPTGAGADLAAARAPYLHTINGTTIAVIAVDGVARYYHATANRPGAAPLSVEELQRAVPAARAAGAKIVIVFPHWGNEFQAEPTSGQRTLARAAIEAGADMVIGGHSHWASAMEVIDGRPVLYGIGNFVFDQNWSIETAQGLLVELTFMDDRLIAMTLHPTQILDQSQPNLLDPAADGDVVLRRVERGSRDLPGW